MFGKKIRKFLPVALLLSLCWVLGSCRAEDTKDPPQEPPEKTPQQVLEEQTADDTHDAFLVDTGGAMGTLLVTAECETEQDEFDLKVRFSVWNPSDMEQPLQTMEKKPLIFPREHQLIDVNFDGWLDFTYCYARGVSSEGYYCWLWNEELGRFEEEPEYAEISSPMVDPETEIISGWNRNSAAGDGVSTFHRWIEGRLVCVRRIEVYANFSDDEPIRMTVMDRVDGELTEVFYTEFPPYSDGYFVERFKWEELDYHGET